MTTPLNSISLQDSAPDDLPVALDEPPLRVMALHTLHVVAHKAYISRSGETLVVKTDDDKQSVPIQQVDAVVIHGYGQMTTQAIHLCSHRGVSVGWMSRGGRFIAGTSASPGRVQQRIRQYHALTEPENCLRLSRALVRAKVESQLRYLMRGTRGNKGARNSCRQHISLIREALRRSWRVTEHGFSTASSVVGSTV